MARKSARPLPLIGEVDIWSASLNWTKRELTESRAVLSVVEQSRADRFLVEHARREYVSSHVILRFILSSYLDCAPQELTFSKHDNGKPFLVSSAGVPIKFNISHSKQKLMVAVTNQAEVGIDIECMRKDIQLLELSERFFAKQEHQALLAMPDHKQLAGFYRCWTQKEAFIKAEGSGLSFGLKNFCVSLEDSQKDGLLSIDQDAKLARSWSMLPLKADSGYMAAVCTEGLIKAINYLPWACR